MLAAVEARAQQRDLVVHHVTRDDIPMLFTRPDEDALQRQLERALRRCSRRRALPVGVHTLTVETDERGRVRAVEGLDGEHRECVARARLRARPSSRHDAQFEVALGPITWALLRGSHPDVTGTGAPSEPDECRIRIVLGPHGRPQIELEVTEADTPPARVRAFFAWGDAWPLRSFAEMTYARSLPSGAHVFEAPLEPLHSGKRVAGWVSVDGGMTMAYCDADGAPFSREQLPVVP